MRWFLRLALFALVLLALAFLASYLTARRWGRDVDRVEHSEKGYSFRAQRSPTGVWRIETSDGRNLAYAMGYLHALDREFQTEVFHQLALGQLSSVFGEKLLNRDRLQRFAARAAEAEWQEVERRPDQEMKQILEAYVAGRKAYLDQPLNPEPLEYRIFGLKRKDFAPWAAKDLLALARLHMWEFSYDYKSEVLARALRFHVGPDLGDLLQPPEPEDSPALYDEKFVKGRVKNQLGRIGQMKAPAPFFPPGQAVASLYPNRMEPPEPGSFYENLFQSQMGASNLWLIQNPHTGLRPTLCNDTHLQLAWPSTLYPFKYVLETRSGERTEGLGFSMPALPMLLIGRVSRRVDPQKPAQDLVWGVTIANYADSQDLVALSPKTLSKAVVSEERFVVRDPRTGARSERHFQEQWTDFGPRVDGIIEWMGADPGQAVALDWFGYRRGHVPLDFFINRNLRGAENLRQDLATRWEFPPVNYSWLERNSAGEVRAGHAVTGLIFEREAQSKGARPRTRRDLISETEARRRKVSTPGQRPYFDHLLEPKDELFLVTGNQRVWSGPLSLRLGYDWFSGLRAGRILEAYDKDSQQPEASQTDTVSLPLQYFVRDLRRLVSVDRLCGDQDLLSPQNCQQIVAELDSWDGSTGADSWVATVAALWSEEFKLGLVGRKRVESDRNLHEVFRLWEHSNGSLRAVENLLNNPHPRMRWERFSGVEFGDLATKSFHRSLRHLLDQAGPHPEQWLWGRFHRVNWQHPFGLIPGELGPLLKDGALGPPPEVSGAGESPAVMGYTWLPEQPLNFSATHGPMIRMCTSLEEGRLRTRWTAATGVSGNPLSKWAWPFARDYYFKERLFEADGAH